MQSNTPRHSVSVAAAVVDAHGRIWASAGATTTSGSPPGGVLQLEESIHEGLVREVLEETGLTVEPGPLTGVYKNMERGIVALVFRCTAVEGAPAARPRSLGGAVAES